ncbi:hypothetical protein [Rhodococcus kronopolitis]|uniref:Antibiotic biosynthesis monooxygenase n=1 Tax=Rhodococcus kronopolitis TaxID=1460226 RepID=A0ABV9FVU9_9NOCA
MSTLVIVRFLVRDMPAAKKSLADNAALLEEIGAEAKKCGGRHHRFAEGIGELVAIDEWDSVEAFQNFFDGNPKIATVTKEAGAQTPPSLEFLAGIEAAGTF